MLGNTTSAWPDVNSLHFCVNNKLTFVICGISGKIANFSWNSFFFLSRKCYITNNRILKDTFSEKCDSRAGAGVGERGILSPIPALPITKDMVSALLEHNSTFFYVLSPHSLICQ